MNYTRWASDTWDDSQWIYVDLGATATVTRVVLNWEAAYGRSYNIQVSPNATSWTTIYSTTTGDGGTDNITGLNASGRYVRMQGVLRGTGWGWSLWAFDIYGTGGAPNPTPTTSALAHAAWTLHESRLERRVQRHIAGYDQLEHRDRRNREWEW